MSDCGWLYPFLLDPGYSQEVKKRCSRVRVALKNILGMKINIRLKARAAQPIGVKDRKADF
jgi:hypothetical protein